MIVILASAVGFLPIPGVALLVSYAKLNPVATASSAFDQASDALAVVGQAFRAGNSTPNPPGLHAETTKPEEVIISLVNKHEYVRSRGSHGGCGLLRRVCTTLTA
jgi:hypothetical protein